MTNIACQEHEKVGDLGSYIALTMLGHTKVVLCGLSWISRLRLRFGSALASGECCISLRVCQRQVSGVESEIAFLDGIPSMVKSTQQRVATTVGKAFGHPLWSLHLNAPSCLINARRATLAQARLACKVPSPGSKGTLDIDTVDCFWQDQVTVVVRASLVER